jgi:hypothetical protein
VFRHLPSGSLARLLAATLLVGCAGGRGVALETPSPERPVGAPELTADDLGTQRLFRVNYRGPDGGGNLRLVLRLAAADDFQLAASDLVGRALWSLAYRGAETLIVDHRRNEYCATGREVRVPEAALAALPLEMLPLVLLGRLPVAVDERDAAAGKIDVLDSLGRRWTARLEEGAPKSWTLWRAEEPSVWWLAQPRGGILSHRSGSQFRWRESVAEALDGALEPQPPPSDYAQVECDDWSLPELREDQSAPPGDRSPK